MAAMAMAGAASNEHDDEERRHREGDDAEYFHPARGAREGRWFSQSWLAVPL